jgi:hypothetical protein
MKKGCRFAVSRRSLLWSEKAGYNWRLSRVLHHSTTRRASRLPAHLANHMASRSRNLSGNQTNAVTVINPRFRMSHIERLNGPIFCFVPSVNGHTTTRLRKPRRQHNILFVSGKQLSSIIFRIAFLQLVLNLLIVPSEIAHSNHLIRRSHRLRF